MSLHNLYIIQPRLERLLMYAKTGNSYFFPVNIEQADILFLLFDYNRLSSRMYYKDGLIVEPLHNDNRLDVPVLFYKPYNDKCYIISVEDNFYYWYINPKYLSRTKSICIDSLNDRRVVKYIMKFGLTVHLLDEEDIDLTVPHLTVPSQIIRKLEDNESLFNSKKHNNKRSSISFSKRKQY